MTFSCQKRRCLLSFPKKENEGMPRIAFSLPFTWVRAFTTPKSSHQARPFILHVLIPEHETSDPLQKRGGGKNDAILPRRDPNELHPLVRVRFFRAAPWNTHRRDCQPEQVRWATHDPGSLAAAETIVACGIGGRKRQLPLVGLQHGGLWPRNPRAGHQVGGRLQCEASRGRRPGKHEIRTGLRDTEHGRSSRGGRTGEKISGNLRGRQPAIVQPQFIDGAV